MIRLVTLDAFNTLFKVRGSVGEIYSQSAKKFGLYLNAEILDLEYKKVYQKLRRKYPNFGVQGNITTQCFWHKIVQSTFKNCGCEDDDLVSKVSSFLYQDFSLEKNWQLFDDVELVLQLLKDRGYNLAVVSNFDERLTDILKGLDIFMYFSFILCSTEVKVAKPFPKIFKLALENGGVEGWQALHVGDSIVKDYNAARAVGMKAYLLDRLSSITQEEKSTIGSCHIISSLRDLPLLD